MPISRAAMPDVASFLPISSERLRFGWPAIIYATSFRSPWARSAVSRREASATINGVHVFVAAAGQTDEYPTTRSHFARYDAGLVQRVRRLERGHDAFEPGAQLERGERVLVAHGHVVHTLEVAQVRVLRSYAWIVEPCGDRVRGQHLALSVLEQIRECAMQHAWASGHESGRVLTALDSRAGRLHTHERDVLIVDES